MQNKQINMDKNKKQIYRQLMWDYNISPEDIDKVIRGEAEFAGHYDINGLFVKMLNNFPYFVVLQIFDIFTVKKLLTDKVIEKLRFKELQKQYFYVKKRLHEII